MTTAELYNELKKIDCDWELVQIFEDSVWLKFEVEEPEEDAEP